MKRFAAIAGVLCTVGLAGTATAAPSSGARAATTPPRSHLRGFECQRSIDPVGRTVSVTAIMRPVSGTQKMSVRFDLLTRTKSSGPFTAVRGGDLGTWLSPLDQPTLGQRPGDVWVLSHPVAALPAPAAYRYRVVFRWVGAKGRVLDTHTRTTASCFEPELRPDLSVRSIAIVPVAGKPNLSSYVVLIRNGGATAAGPFVLQFATSGRVVSRIVPRLGAHKTRTETFLGPVCTSATAPVVTVDPSQRILDFNPSNNRLQASCRAAGS